MTLHAYVLPWCETASHTIDHFDERSLPLTERFFAYYFVTVTLSKTTEDFRLEWRGPCVLFFLVSYFLYYRGFGL